MIGTRAVTAGASLTAPVPPHENPQELMGCKCTWEVRTALQEQEGNPLSHPPWVLWLLEFPLSLFSFLSTECVLEALDSFQMSC